MRHYPLERYKQSLEICLFKIGLNIIELIIDFLQMFEAF